MPEGRRSGRVRSARGMTAKEECERRTSARDKKSAKGKKKCQGKEKRRSIRGGKIACTERKDAREWRKSARGGRKGARGEWCASFPFSLSSQPSFPLVKVYIRATQFARF